MKNNFCFFLLLLLGAHVDSLFGRFGNFTADAVVVVAVVVVVVVVDGVAAVVVADTVVAALAAAKHPNLIFHQT